MLLFWLGNFILQNHQLKLSQFFVLNLYLRLKRKTKSIWQVGAGGSYPQNSADSKVIPKPSTSVRLEIETDHLIEKITIKSNKTGATQQRTWLRRVIFTYNLFWLFEISPWHGISSVWMFDLVCNWHTIDTPQLLRITIYTRLEADSSQPTYTNCGIRFNLLYKVTIPLIEVNINSSSDGDFNPATKFLSQAKTKT